MTDRKVHGQALSDEQIQAWADEAEAGYDAATPRRHGRLPVGDSPDEA